MRQAEEVSEQGGFRWLMFAILAAGLVGSLVRLSLAPAKIEKLIRTKLESSAVRDNLAFGTAEISLADGLLPDLALVLTRVEWRGSKQGSGSCGEVAPIRARLVRVPLRMVSLLSGTPSVGNVKIDDLTVDLDELKRDCGPSTKSVAAKTRSGGEATSDTLATSLSASAKASTSKTPTLTPSEVWSVEDQEKISAMIHGVRVSRAEVFFEDRMKSVVLEDAAVTWRGDALDVSTSLKFPPATVFGENLPTFTITGVVRRHEMLGEIRADLNEGTLEANAILKPVVTANGSKELDAELKLSVSDLPLSVVTPILSKSRIVTGAFRPKFMWLDCNAEVHGVFSRLFVDNPVSLSSCEVSGQVGRLTLESATRLPSGAWKPFEAVVEKLDIARVLETFDLQGPSGVLANFGLLSGRVTLNSPESAEATGSVANTVIRFAGGEGTALQPVSIGKLEAKLANHRWTVGLSEFTPEGGDADLRVNADLDEAGRDAKVDVVLKRLKLNSRVEKAVFTGSVADIKGVASFATGFLSESAGTQFSRLKAELNVEKMKGSEIDADEVKIDAQLVKNEIEVGAKSANVEVLKSGRLFKLLQPALLGWNGVVAKDGERLLLDKVAVKGRFRENGFQWNQANAMVGSTLNLSSHGHIYRDHGIDSELEAHYPLASKLKWNVGGTWLKPKFTAGSNELGALFVKAGLPKDSVVGTVPGRLLGLPKEADASAGEAEASPAEAPDAAKPKSKDAAKAKDTSHSKEAVAPKTL